MREFHLLNPNSDWSFDIKRGLGFTIVEFVPNIVFADFASKVASSINHVDSRVMEEPAFALGLVALGAVNILWYSWKKPWAKRR